RIKSLVCRLAAAVRGPFPGRGAGGGLRAGLGLLALGRLPAAPALGRACLGLDRAAACTAGRAWGSGWRAPRVRGARSPAQQYKYLQSKSEPHVKIEGKDTDDWLCMDFGSMVIHLMLPETRETYE
uniref:Uncharacterized protein n=1 Tax=Canis lupus familiaris TaxID=9615 RepID=A0A8P0TNV4_CANLF